MSFPSDSATGPQSPAHARFEQRAAFYRSHRPSYPTRAIDAALAGLAPAETLSAVDVGAGTGISARLLAERGLAVIAVEPNASMAQAAVPHARVRWERAVAERLPLADASVDLVLAAQAFHWFDAHRALREFARVLPARGRLALLWNVRDLTDPFTAQYSTVLARAAARVAEESWHLWPEELAASGWFGTCWEQGFANEQTLDRDGLIGRALSTSYAPLAGEARAGLERELTLAHAQYADTDGLTRLRYRTRLYLAERLPEATV